MLRLQGENLYRAGAYEGGAEAVELLTEDLTTLVDEGRLTDVRGIGPSLAAVITDLVRTGHSSTLDRIMGDLPAGLLELAFVPGLTLRRIRALHDQLGIEGMEDLRQALAAGAVETVKGFGARTVAKLHEAVEHPPSPSHRIVLVEALAWSSRLAAHLRELPSVVDAAVVGSLRRWVETVGDVNLLAASDRPEAIVEAFVKYPAVAAVDERGPSSCRVRLTGGLPVTLDVRPPRAFAVGLLLSTGSAAHVGRLKDRAQKRGLALDQLSGPDEGTLYAALGLPFIPPELREDAGELEAADAGDDFGDLLTLEDVRGIVHCHSVYSDGRNTIEAMARAAAEMGREYLTITDHSPTASYAGGVPIERLHEQWKEIAALEGRLPIRILRGTESDILRDGALDYPNDVLESLDVVVASIHERHKMSADAMTERIVNAIHHPVFKIWGHALGRLLLRRPPIDCDVGRVLDAVATSRAAIELNGSPYRMDLPAEWVRLARQKGIKFVISADAHSTAELANVRYGVALARRGGLRRREVLNTLAPDDFARAVSPRLP
ncbi:MAG: polymerase [Chloroflexota bacterium]|nr:polymerase [Chloroflexota bacterium]